MSKKRPPSIMGDDDRAQQPRPQHVYPPSVEVSGEIEIPSAVPGEIFESHTPPPIVVDDIGRPVVRQRSNSPSPPIQGPRPRKTMQEIVEDLWPARKALQLQIEHLQRIVILETKLEEMESNGPAAVAAAHVDKLRVELVGHDGHGGSMGALAFTVTRDIAEHKRAVQDVEERATRDARFVRKILYAAGSLVAGSIVAAVVLIYQAGGKAEQGKAEVRESRQEVMYKFERLDSALTELRGQVKLLLESQIRGKQ